LNKEELEFLIYCNMSQRDIASHLNSSQGSVRHWLSKYNLSTTYKNKLALPDRKVCSACKVDKPNAEFWKRNNREHQLHSMCKDCNLKDRLSRQRDFKQQCVDYKGGECQCCGYNNCNHALDFHHVDPKTKSFGIAKARRTKVTKKILEELDKCILVCSNCHREIHAGYIDLSKGNISNLQEL
tara:strand:- start:446 stop:994 length:549 start_codon:yes stop_codon:yes gene_type:complete